MSLIELTTESTIDRVQNAIALLRQFEPAVGYYLAFSGGKDSVVVYDLCQRAGVKFDAHQNLTSVDPPELIRFVRAAYPCVTLHTPEETMWQIIAREKNLPLRNQRFCCEVLKEGGGENRVVLTGVRRQESSRRAKRRTFETCRRSGANKIMIHPIIDWSEADVWEYIRTYAVPSCPLYAEGWKRIGCVCCPMSNQRKEAKRWPKIAAAYVRVLDRVIADRIANGYPTDFTSGEQWFQFWISGKARAKADPDQTIIFE